LGTIGSSDTEGASIFSLAFGKDVFFDCMVRG
jgi:hypothetical protein